LQIPTKPTNKFGFIGEVTYAMRSVGEEVATKGMGLPIKTPLKNARAE